MKTNFIDSYTTIASWIPRLSLSVLLALCPSSPAWSQVKNAEIIGSPLVEDDRIIIRIKVTDNNDRPVVNLEDIHFELTVDDKEFDGGLDWESPEEAEPPPAWIIILLDYSGSMQQQDLSGITKLAGAIKAIREFIGILQDRGGNTQVAIVPFGDAGKNCKGYPVKNESLDKFFPARDAKLSNYLKFLGDQTPCASTNIYEPLTRAIRFFGDQQDPRFFLPEDSREPQPRLGIILLSDGYHNKPNEPRDFENLKKRLSRNDRITVHTLGYGLTPEQLGQQYELDGPATREDVRAGRVPEVEFVDRDRLAEIARVTGGVAEFSPDAVNAAEKLKVFLDALLGEYQISYIEPNPERGSKHDVRVVVIDTDDSSRVESESKSYTITVFGRSLSFRTRITMLLTIFAVLAVAGVLPFWLWARNLKQEA